MLHEGRLLLLILLASCGPPQPSDESDAGEVDELTQACEAFCEVAIACSSDEFANAWEFETTIECKDDCVKFTQYRIDFDDRPECEMIGIEMWTCAGEITECPYFESFEDESYALIGLVENPCWTETDLFLEECN